MDIKKATIQELVDELDIREGIGYQIHHAGEKWFTVYKDRGTDTNKRPEE